MRLEDYFLKLPSHELKLLWVLGLLIDLTLWGLEADLKFYLCVCIRPCLRRLGVSLVLSEVMTL